MAVVSVNRPGGWNILDNPLRHQLGEGARPLKDPPQLIGNLAHRNRLLFHRIASGVILRRNRAVYPTISHPHRPLRTSDILSQHQAARGPFVRIFDDCYRKPPFAKQRSQGATTPARRLFLRCFPENTAGRGRPALPFFVFLRMEEYQNYMLDK